MASIYICAHPRKLAEAEPRLLEYVKRRAIGALDQCKVAAEEPFAVRELPLKDSDHGRQSFFALRDRVLRLD